MKNYFSISELLEMNLENLPRTVRGLTYKADREKWIWKTSSDKQGGQGVKKLYTPPPVVLKQIQAVKLNRALADTATSRGRAGRYCLKRPIKLP